MSYKFFAIFSKVLFGLFLFPLSLSASHQEEDRPEYFIIGSNRLASSDGDLIKRFHQEIQADFSHRKTFDGKAITVDLQEADLKGCLHLKTDAIICTFPAGIRGIYIERFPSFHMKREGDIVFDYIEQLIKNLSPKLISQATLEIEWLPFNTLLDCDLSIDSSSCYSARFNGLFKKNIIFQVLKLSLSSSQNRTQSEISILQSLQNEIKQLNNLISFYCHEIQISEKELRKHLKRETNILYHLSENDCLVGLTYEPVDGIEKFKIAYQNKIWVDKPKGIDFAGQYVWGQKTYNKMTYLKATVLNSLLGDLAVIHNKENVKVYLEKQGFEQVTIERTTSPYNHRKNIWLIRAIKS